MKVNITDKYILIINEDFSLIHFLTNIENQYNNFENNNLILDLTNNVDANKIDYKIFKEFAKKQKKHKKIIGTNNKQN